FITREWGGGRVACCAKRQTSNVRRQTSNVKRQTSNVKRQTLRNTHHAPRTTFNRSACAGSASRWGEPSSL
ncbi:MAG: hypothetical protein D6796_06270, partial [Caldilineae bacterium]